jgi:hypothetical protein
MSTLRWRHPFRRNADYPIDELLLDSLDMISLERADCCSARAAYRAVLPTAGRRDRPADLLLCGHHYRSSHDALRSTGATVYDATNRLIASPALAG